MKDLGEQPWHFVKTSRSSIVGPTEWSRCPRIPQNVGLGSRARGRDRGNGQDVPTERRWPAVAGYTIANDLSARDRGR